MKLRWQMLGIGREYRLFQEKQIVGILKNNFWNRKGYGELHGFLVRFEKTGNGSARMLDIEGEKVLGTIDLRFFPQSAVIHYEGQPYAWAYSQKTHRKSWAVTGEEETTSYKAGGFLPSAGTITEAYLPPVVVLAGLYVRGYFLKRLVFICLAAFLAGLLAAFAFP